MDDNPGNNSDLFLKRIYSMNFNRLSLLHNDSGIARISNINFLLKGETNHPASDAQCLTPKLR
ncbi:MAG: hypothetical protein ABSE72_03295 [Bacteroidales bacterium]